MQNPRQNAASNKQMRDGFGETGAKMMKTFAGFDYEVSETDLDHFLHSQTSTSISAVG